MITTAKSRKTPGQLKAGSELNRNVNVQAKKIVSRKSNSLIPLYLQRIPLQKYSTYNNTNDKGIQRQPIEEEEEEEELQANTNTAEAGVQAKLTVGEPNDEYEKEADQVADTVMRMPENAGVPVPEEEQELVPGAQVQTKLVTPGTIQRLCAGCEEELEEQQGAMVQTKSNGESAVASGSHVAKAVHSPAGGHSVPDHVRNKVEPVLNRDMSDVRVHDNETSYNAAQQINARAFTHQNHIYLGKGQSINDTELMAHELTHVKQQTGSMRNGSPIASSRISRWSINVPGGIATSDRNSDTLWGLSRLLTGQGVLWTNISPIHMQSPRAGDPEFWRYIWIGDTFNIDNLVMLVAFLPWNPNTMVTFLTHRGDEDTVRSLLDRGYSIYRYTTTIVTWRDNATGIETEVDETGSMGGTCEDGTEMGCEGAKQILIRTGLPTNEAASTLFHERGHVISVEPDYLEQEIEVRIAEEEFRIRHGMPEAEPGYRNPDGTVNEAAIRLSVMSSSFYNPSTRTMVASRDTGRRRTHGWARLLRRIAP